MRNREPPRTDRVLTWAKARTDKQSTVRTRSTRACYGRASACGARSGHHNSHCGRAALATFFIWWRALSRAERLSCAGVLLGLRWPRLEVPPLLFVPCRVCKQRVGRSRVRAGWGVRVMGVRVRVRVTGCVGIARAGLEGWGWGWGWGWG